MATTISSYSSTTEGLRLYVYIRIVKLPAVVEVEFPESRFGIELAERYRKSIEGNKILPRSRQKPGVVAFELPPSVLDLETNKSLRAFVLHFDAEREARRFEDAICLGVKGHKRQVFIKQYWEPEDMSDLMRTLPKAAERREKLPERAGTPPGIARGSRTHA